MGGDQLCEEWVSLSMSHVLPKYHVFIVEEKVRSVCVCCKKYLVKKYTSEATIGDSFSTELRLSVMQERDKTSPIFMQMHHHGFMMLRCFRSVCSHSLMSLDQ